MTLQDDERQILSNLYMEKAQKSLAVSEEQKNSNPDISISRAYYSMFYAAQGALIQEGAVAIRKHEGVNNKFSKHFVKSGEFPKDIFRMMGRLEQDRYEADYNPRKAFSPEQAEKSIENARKFVGAVAEMVKKRMEKSRVSGVN